MRIYHELEYYKEHNAFITLTYADEALPDDMSVHKEVLRNYIKRTRKNTGVKFKYYAVGEYGEKQGRPHYHLITLGLSIKNGDFRFSKWDPIQKINLYWSKSWKNGYVHVGTVSPHSIRYVTDYVKTKLTGQRAKDLYGQRESPFNLVSQGIGRRYCEANAETLKEHRSFNVQGVRHGLSRYYKNILGIKNSEYSTQLLERAFMKELAAYVSLMERSGTMDPLNVKETEKVKLLQLDKNIRHRAQLYNKKL
jgi:hypothetical protein